MGKIPTNSLGKSFELKLHCFCLYNAYSMPKDIYSVSELEKQKYFPKISKLMLQKCLSNI